MKILKLKHDKETIIDDDVYEWAKGYKWYQNNSGYVTTFFYPPHKKRWGIQTKLIIVILHHAVLGYPLNKLEVDHKNGDKLDNRRENLRQVTHRANSHNRKEHCRGRLVGASFHKRNNLWQSYIYINGKQNHLGYFKTEQDAHEAYIKALENKTD